jgi:hypothetical protein
MTDKVDQVEGALSDWPQCRGRYDQEWIGCGAYFQPYIVRARKNPTRARPDPVPKICKACYVARYHQTDQGRISRFRRLMRKTIAAAIVKGKTEPCPRKKV